MSMESSIRISRIVFDILILACFAIPLLIFEIYGKPYKRGFYCDDESIRYPYRDSTVSRQLLTVLALIIPIVLILATEVFRVTVWERRWEDQYKTYRLGCYAIHRIVVRVYCFIGYFLLGICFNLLMVDIAKYTIGRHRPHFMEVCRPSAGYTTCTDPTRYIVDYECTGTDAYRVNDSQLSFYSGHSANSFYVACFTSLYLRARLYRPVLSRLLVPAIQFCLILGASYVALTRISDYKHHWSDVLVGVIIGSINGIATALYVAEVFERREVPPCLPTKQFGLVM